MNPESAELFGRQSVDHTRFHVGDVAAATRDLVDRYGFVPLTSSDPARLPGERSVVLGSGGIVVVLTQALVDDHPATAFVDKHGDGVADIAITAVDAAAAFAEAVRRGARPVHEPVTSDGVTTACVAGFGDVVHTFVQRSGGVNSAFLPGFAPFAAAVAESTNGLHTADHFAVCLEAGQLDPTVDWYLRVLDFEATFEERIVVGSQAMNSRVVQSRSRGVTLTLIEPDTSRDSGQIDEFLKNNDGPGVQHMALATDDIVRSVRGLTVRGVEFLNTPDTYYNRLPERLHLLRYSVEELRECQLLADEDHDGQLFQVFAKSTHPARTFFFEVIERRGARTFGSGNIKALYEAVESDRLSEA